MFRLVPIKTEMPACMLSYFSRFQLFVTQWTGACQAPLSTGFSRQKYRNRLPCPPPGDLPDPGIEPMPLAAAALPVDPLLLNHQGSPVKVYEQCSMKAYYISHTQRMWAIRHWKKGSYHNLTCWHPNLRFLPPEL